MVRLISRILVSILFLVIFYSATSFAEETITITTYYPSPQGSYLELRAQRMAIGDTYYQNAQYCWPGGTCATGINANTDLVVEGRVGIGEVAPAASLQVAGSMVNTEFDNVLAVLNGGIEVGYSRDLVGPNTRGIVRVLDGGPATYMPLEIGADYIMFITGTGAEHMRITASGAVGIGTSTPDSDILLQLDSTAKAFLPPRLDNAQRQTLTNNSPPRGSVIYYLDDDELQYYDGTGWVGQGAASCAVQWEGYSSATYQGWINFGGAVGIKAMNAVCQAEYPGSHACTYEEIIRLGPNYQWSQNAWIVDGHIYNTGTNSCAAWQTNAAGMFGTSTTSAPAASTFATTTCNSWLSIPCCS